MARKATGKAKGKATGEATKQRTPTPTPRGRLRGRLRLRLVIFAAGTVLVAAFVAAVSLRGGDGDSANAEIPRVYAPDTPIKTRALEEDGQEFDHLDTTILNPEQEVYERLLSPAEVPSAQALDAAASVRTLSSGGEGASAEDADAWERLLPKPPEPPALPAAVPDTPQAESPPAPLDLAPRLDPIAELVEQTLGGVEPEGEGVRTPYARTESRESTESEPEPEPAPPSQRWVVQAASLATPEAARGELASVLLRHPYLTAHPSLVEEAEIGESQAVWRVVFGPWAREAEARALCTRILEDGRDCLVRLLRRRP